MSVALDPLRLDGGPEVDCVTLEQGPFGVESQADVDRVSVLVREQIVSSQKAYDAFVIACFSDPGLFAAREAIDKPIFGIAQSGLLMALSLGQRVGVVSILDASIPRHWRYWHSLGMAQPVVGDRAINTSVAELADESTVLDRMISVGQQLKQNHGADVLLLGCAGMARYREKMEDALQIPVVDPTQAAVGMAITTISLSR